MWFLLNQVLFPRSALFLRYQHLFLDNSWNWWNDATPLSKLSERFWCRLLAWLLQGQRCTGSLMFVLQWQQLEGPESTGTLFLPHAACDGLWSFPNRSCSNKSLATIKLWSYKCGEIQAGQVQVYSRQCLPVRITVWLWNQTSEENNIQWTFQTRNARRWWDILKTSVHSRWSADAVLRWNTLLKKKKSC